MTALTSLSGSSAYQYYAQSLLTSGSSTTSETTSTEDTTNGGLGAIFDSMSLQSGSSSEEATSASDSALSTDSVLSDDTLQALFDQMEVSDTDMTSTLSDMISSMDTDSDGTITEEEFIAARPDDVTEDMAANLWDQFDTESAGSLSTDDLETAMASSAPPMGGAGGSEETDSSSYSSLDTNEDGVVSLNEILAAQSEGVDVSSYGIEAALDETVEASETASAEVASVSTETATTSTFQSIQNQFLEAISSYQSSAAYANASMNLSQMMSLV